MIQHIILDYCWVCEDRFVDSNPPGPKIRHNHHIVPQAFGGVDGPQVTLCTDHHNKLHSMARAMTAGKSLFKFVHAEPPEARKKLEWLANVVYSAELTTRGDPNKIASVMVHLDQDQRIKIDALKKIYPKAGSRANVLAIALELLYKRHFTN